MLALLNTVYAVLMAALSVSVFAVPAWSAASWAAITLLSVGAIGFGVRRNRPRHRAPWWLLGGAVLAMGTGDTIYGAVVRQPTEPTPAIAEVCYLAMIPLVGVGLFLLTRTNAVLGDRSRLTDLLIFTCAAGLVCWVFLIGPTVDAEGMSTTDKSLQAGYALGDLLILVTAVRLTIATRRGTAVLLLGLGAAGLLISDVVYLLDQLSTGWTLGSPAEFGYLAFYAGWGAAALQPSMVSLTVPADTWGPRLRRRWMVLLGLSLTIPPGTLFVEAMTGPVRDGAAIAFVSAGMSALVITRLTDALTKHRRAIVRERDLRQACGTLVSAADPDQIVAAVRAAIGRLMPPGAEHRVVIALHEIVDDGADTSSTVRFPYPLPGTAAERRTRLLPTRTLHPDLHGDLAGLPATLLCPLVVDRRVSGDPGLGALFAAAEHHVLAPLQDSVEVLAAQATLALERVALTDIANRRDSDRYVREVIRNTVDVVLIVDDDHRIRYASPSLGRLLGRELPLFATLFELIDPDDRDQVSGTLARAQTAEPGAHEWWDLRRPDGTRVTVEASCRDLRRDRMVRGFVITLRDLAEDAPPLTHRGSPDSAAEHNRQSSHHRFE